MGRFHILSDESLRQRLRFKRWQALGLVAAGVAGGIWLSQTQPGAAQAEVTAPRLQTLRLDCSLSGHPAAVQPGVCG